MINIIIPIQNLPHSIKPDPTPLPLSAHILLTHLPQRKPPVHKRIGQKEHHIPLHPAQMETQERALRLQAGLDRIVQIDPQHPHQIHRIHVHRINHIRDIHLHLNLPVHRQEQLRIQDALQLQHLHMQQTVQSVILLGETLLHRQDMPIEKLPQLLIPPLLDISRQRSHHIDIIMPERAQIIIDHLQIPRVLLQMLQILHLLPRLIIPPHSVQHDKKHAECKQKIQHKGSHHQKILPVGDLYSIKKRSHSEDHISAEQKGQSQESQQLLPHPLQNIPEIPQKQPPHQIEGGKTDDSGTDGIQYNPRRIRIQLLHGQIPQEIERQPDQIAEYAIQYITNRKIEEHIVLPGGLHQQHRMHPQCDHNQRIKGKISLYQKKRRNR